MKNKTRIKMLEMTIETLISTISRLQLEKIGLKVPVPDYKQNDTAIDQKIILGNKNYHLSEDNIKIFLKKEDPKKKIQKGMLESDKELQKVCKINKLSDCK